MYVIVGNPEGQLTYTCCPIQHAEYGIKLTEIRLPENYGGFTSKECKIQAHQIFTMPASAFKDFAGRLREPEISKLKLQLLNYLELQDAIRKLA